MKCTKCKAREASVFYREIINGKETKYALCSECAKEKEKQSTSLFDIPDLFQGSLLGSFFQNSPKLQKQEKKRCTLCNSTFHDLCNTGKAGCPVCYSVFREELAPTLKRLHGTSTHRGKVPGAMEADMKREREIKELEEQLKNAISEEKYEDAATIRDKLREMRGTK